LRLEINSIESQLEVYLKLIEITLKTKNEFEIEVHPKALNKYQVRCFGMIYDLVTLILDLVKIPTENIGIRQFYYDLIIEHIDRKTIIKEHLLEMLINWENHDIIIQAE
jgi:hypothetical protein